MIRSSLLGCCDNAKTFPGTTLFFVDGDLNLYLDIWRVVLIVMLLVGFIWEHQSQSYMMIYFVLMIGFQRRHEEPELRSYFQPKPIYRTFPALSPLHFVLCIFLRGKRGARMNVDVRSGKRLFAILLSVITWFRVQFVVDNLHGKRILESQDRRNFDSTRYL